MVKIVCFNASECSVSGVDSHSCHCSVCSGRLNRPARDPPLTSKHVRQICDNFSICLTPDYLDL